MATPEGAERALDLHKQANSQSAILHFFSDFLDRAESAAFEIYRRRGLPCVAGFYVYEDAGWRLVLRRTDEGTPKAECEPADSGSSLVRHFDLGRSAGPDSDLGVAADILRQAEDCRGWQRRGFWSPERAFVEAISLCRDLQFLFLEFNLELAAIVAPAGILREGQSRGGANRAALKKDALKRNVTRWQEEDAKVRMTNPSLRSKSDRATQVAKRLLGSEWAAPANRIRRYLEPLEKVG